MSEFSRIFSEELNSKRAQQRRKKQARSSTSAGPGPQPVGSITAPPPEEYMIVYTGVRFWPHFILTICTLGLWFPIWMILFGIYGSYRAEYVKRVP